MEAQTLFRRPGAAFFTVLTCLLMPASGVYYAFFGAFLTAVATVAALGRGGGRRTVLASATVLGLIAASLAAHLAPSLIYFSRHGRSPEVAKRTAWEAEHFGLKIHQLLMPALGHRWPLLQKFGIHGVIGPGETRRVSMNDVNENETSSLGIVGVCGFLALIVSLFLPTKDDDLTVPLGRLTVASILLGTVGGFGVVFSRLVSTQIRAYNRISVYVAFYALFAAAMGLDAAWTRLGTSPLRRFTFLAGLSVLLAVGIWDQSPAATVPDHDRERLEFAEDARFVREIEAAIADRPSVFMLPYVAFPESLPMGRMRDYDHLWGYFHSRTLKWSYGAIKGRETDLWQKAAAAKSVPGMVAELKAKGFGGVTVDRLGFADGGRAIEAELEEATGSKPSEGPGGRIAFFRLP